METYEKIKKILTCSKPSHCPNSLKIPLEETSYICTDPECPQNELVCYLCIEESHQKCEKQNIKILLNNLSENQSINQSILLLSSKIDKIMEEICQSVKEVYEDLNDPKNVLAVIGNYVDLKKKNVMNVFGLADELERMFKIGDSGEVEKFKETFCTFLIANLQYLLSKETEKQKTNNNRLEYQTIYSTALQNLEEELLSIKSSLLSQIKSNTITDNNILSLFPYPTSQSFRVFKPYFSENLKGTTITITPTSAIMTSASSQRVVAMEPSLQATRNVKKWKIKITKLVSWIGVGACHINKLKEAGWLFNYSEAQHGSYFISSNGYCWSSYKPEFNSKMESFHFKTGDVILVEFNVNEKKLKFAKENTNENYSIDVDVTTDPLYPAVNLTGVGDNVEIL